MAEPAGDSDLGAPPASPAGSSALAAARRRQEWDERAAATIRALSGDPTVQLRLGRPFRGDRLLPVRAAHLHPHPGVDDEGSFRGVADAIALRLRWSDLDLHNRHCPRDSIGRLLFDLLEQYRVESLADPSMPGLAGNLRHRHRQWSLAFHRSGLTETEAGLLLFTVAQVCRARICGDPLLDETESLLESPRFALAPVIGDLVAALAATRHDQARYAEHALALAEVVSAMVPGIEPVDAADGPAPAAGADARFTLFADVEDGDGGPAGVGGSGGCAGAADDGTGYRIFTTAYDRELPATAGLRPDLVRSYRERLDALVASSTIDLPRLCRQLHALQPEPGAGGWESDREEGHLDGRLLTRLVTAPGENRVFRVEHPENVPTLDVTVLVDCSGSMKDHAEQTAVLVDVLSRALDLVGCHCEVLGFTTGAWHGGRAWRDWLAAGRPRRPGRLTEVTHLVFQPAATPWREARRSIATLLHEARYREGVDGEALAWAGRRAAIRAESTGAPGVLLVVSDGCPTDSATALANGDAILGEHLEAIVARLAAERLVGVGAVGPTAELASWYPHWRVLDLSAGVRTAVLDDVVDVLSRARPRPRR